MRPPDRLSRLPNVGCFPGLIHGCEEDKETRRGGDKEKPRRLRRCMFSVSSLSSADHNWRNATGAAKGTRLTENLDHHGKKDAPRGATSAIGVALEYDAFGRLVLSTPTGERHTGVVPVRGFPFSAPTECISFCDDYGREVLFLTDLAQLRPPIRELLEADLARREFIPLIQTIYSVSTGAEPTDWHVLTNRGETRFVLNNEDSIRRMGPHGALITDSHGIRLRIEDTRALDPASRRILQRYL